MKRQALVLLCCVICWPVMAVVETYQFDSAQTEADYNRLIYELRCLVCQNQNLADSNADLARDLRRETYQMLQAGKTPDEVVEFMVARYGDFVLYRPQFKASTYVLWLGPAVLLVVALFLVMRRLRTAGASEVDNEALERARQLLEDEDRDKNDKQAGGDDNNRGGS